MECHGPSRPQRAFPAWALVLAGALVAQAWRERPGAGNGPEQGPPSDPRVLLERGSARALRGLPGLGERRARALVDARWRRGPGDPPLYLHELPGVGPALEAAVRAVLESAQDGAADSP